MRTHINGFTLVELSIALVVIGLLTGGVLVGKNILRGSEVQTIMADMKRFEGAIIQFTEQYNGVPGDITNATDYWGTDPNGCPSNANQNPRKETCNGDGDGFVRSAPERFRTWQQLANAGFVPGTFSGVAGTGSGTHAVPGINVPAGKLPESAYAIIASVPFDSTDVSWFEGDYGNFLLFGYANNGNPSGGVIRGADAATLDAKGDDGRPGTGLMRTTKSATNCHTSTDPAISEYDMRSSVKGCNFIYIMGR